jgi:protein-serine/threonine kinase
MNAAGPAFFHGTQSPDATHFNSTTITPSPPDLSTSPPTEVSTLTLLDTSLRLQQPTQDTLSARSPLSAGLRISTDITPGYMVTAASASNTGRASGELSRPPPPPPPKPAPVARTPSIKNVFSGSLGSSSNIGSAPGSALSSPMLNAMHMPDVTPLPSPLMTGDSPGPWKKLVKRTTSRDLSVPHTADSALVTANGESISSAIANQSKRRAYHNLVANAGESPLANSAPNLEESGGGHRRNRSISEYVPDAILVPKPRNLTVSGTHAPHATGTPDSATSVDGQLRREPHLAAQRGLAPIPR